MTRAIFIGCLKSGVPLFTLNSNTARIVSLFGAAQTGRAAASPLSSPPVAFSTHAEN